MALASRLGVGRTGIPIVELAFDDAQTVAIGALATASASVASEVARITGNKACYICAAVAPVATSAHMYLPANTPELIALKSGWKISVIRAVDGETGTLSIVPAVTR